MHSRSVLTTVIAFGAASSALAIPLPSSSALGSTVSSSTIPVLAPTTINARELELSVLDGNEWHPLAHYARELDKQHIDAVAQLLGKENMVVPLLTWILAFPQAQLSEQLANIVRISSILRFPFHVFDDHTESPLPLPDPMVVLPKVESESLTLTLDVARPAPGLSPIRIERRTGESKMSDKEVTNYLLGLPESDRIALQMHIKMSSSIETQIQTSNNWVEFQKMEGVEGFIKEVTQTVEYQSIGSFPEFIKAYYLYTNPTTRPSHINNKPRRISELQDQDQRFETSNSFKYDLACSLDMVSRRSMWMGGVGLDKLDDAESDWSLA
ncbi:hypothetical protein F5877DRAFT_71251 [Lentinula edodes]|nr:hypothetical protein F5877DRAFT_71251 [Lentinula edodes]